MHVMAKTKIDKLKFEFLYEFMVLTISGLRMPKFSVAKYSGFDC